MRSSAARAYSLLFLLSGATGLVYELLWVRLLYQAFGSTVQSVTTVVAAYMGGLGLGAWLLGRWADRHARPAALYGGLEIAIGVFGLVSPLVLSLAHRVYVAAAGAWQLSGAASVALRFGLAALVLLVPTTLMGGTLPVLTRAFMGADRAALQPSLGRLYGLNTLGAVLGTALAGFFLIEYVGIRASLWGTALVNLSIGVVALRLPDPRGEARGESADRGREPGEAPAHALQRVALLLLALTAFASLLDEIAWTRVLVMIVGGSTYAFTLVLLVFLLGIGVGSAVVARRSAPAPEAAADVALAQGVTAAGAAALFVVFGLLPRYIIAVFQAQSLGATERLLAMGFGVGAVVLIPALGMGMTFPLLTDLVALRDVARGSDVGRAYALNTLGSIAGAVLTGFVLVATLGTDRTLRIGVAINAWAALTLAVLVARRVAEGSEQHHRLPGDRLWQRRHHARARRRPRDGAGARSGDRARRAGYEPVLPARERHRAHPAYRLRRRRRRAERAPDRPGALRRDRLRALEPVARGRRDPLYAGVLPDRAGATHGGRRLLPVGAAV